MTLDKYKIGDLVDIYTRDASCKCNIPEWFPAEVVDVGIYEYYITNKLYSCPKVKVKHLRTYWSEEGLFKKENEEWFYYEHQIRLRNEHG